MFKPLPLFIGLRYTRAKRRNHFISFISLISMLGMILGVAVLILVLSVMNGFDRELRERILGMVPHATIHADGGVADWRSVAARATEDPDVIAAAPFIQGQMMLTHMGNVQGALVNGILPEAEAEVSIIKNHMEVGQLDNLQSGEFGIILGDLLARSLRANVGSKVTLVMPQATASPAGVLPRLKRFTVVGIFKVGAQLDGSLALIHLDDGAKLYRLGDAVHGVRLKLHDLFKSGEVAWRIVRELPGSYWASDWTRTQGNLFQAIKLEKTMIGLLLLMIVAVAAFNIISTLVMVVTDKRSDIAILRTMGASPRTIMLSFMVQGAVIGVIGTLIGTLLGIVLALSVSDVIAWIENLLDTQILSAEVYFISYIPSQLLAQDVLIVCGSALLMSFIATLYPSMRAARVQPAEALRYE
ncbi:MAG: lipoprotein-releasing ABC transporter permease subunit [Pseudomonadales bacterium]|jgi:lipoprotein-releasing system permease protein